MKPRLRMSPQTIQVLDAFLEDPKAWKYGYDISRTTGLKSGTGNEVMSDE
jgi:PadR family transcriptional regulator PadR